MNAFVRRAVPLAAIFLALGFAQIAFAGTTWRVDVGAAECNIDPLGLVLMIR